MDVVFCADVRLLIFQAYASGYYVSVRHRDARAPQEWRVFAAFVGYAVVREHYVLPGFHMVGIGRGRIRLVSGSAAVYGRAAGLYPISLPASRCIWLNSLVVYGHHPVLIRGRR